MLFVRFRAMFREAQAVEADGAAGAFTSTGRSCHAPPLGVGHPEILYGKNFRYQNVTEEKRRIGRACGRSTWNDLP